MNMNEEQEPDVLCAGRPDGRVPYSKPTIQRVDLALEETMSAGCKLNGSECTDPFPGISDAGS